MKWRKFVLLVLICGLVLTVQKGVEWSYLQYTRHVHLGGTIVVPDTNKIILMNPNDIHDVVEISLQAYTENKKRYLCSPVVQDDGIYFLSVSSTEKDKTIPYGIVRLTTHGFEEIPVQNT